MILHLSPHAPLALRILADAALVTHIGGAFTALAAMVLAGVGSEAPHGRLGGEPYQIAYGFAAIAGLAGACDLTVLLQGGIAGPRRIARHLWRMGLALFITAGSFAGQPKAQPDFLRGSPFLIVPALIILGAVIFWLIKVQLPNRRRAAPAPALSLSA